MRHLEREGLVRTFPISSDDRAVVLSDRGRDLLEANRREQERSWEPRQCFYAGLRKPRELTHDSKVHRAYQRGEERLRQQDGRVGRVVLDYELKRDYQRFLHVIAGGRIATEDRTASPMRSLNGLAGMTCRTTTVMSTSLMPGSSTKTVTGDHATKKCSTNQRVPGLARRATSGDTSYVTW